MPTSTVQGMVSSSEGGDGGVVSAMTSPSPSPCDSACMTCNRGCCKACSSGYNVSTCSCGKL